MIFSVEGVLEAFEFGGTCLQAAAVADDIIGPEIFIPPSPLSEDCLTLNLWVPHPQQKRRSVMVCTPVSGPYPGPCVCARVCVCVRVRARARVCVCVCARARACVRVCLLPPGAREKYIFCKLARNKL